MPTNGEQVRQRVLLFPSNISRCCCAGERRVYDAQRKLHSLQQVHIIITSIALHTPFRQAWPPRCSMPSHPSRTITTLILIVYSPFMIQQPADGARFLAQGRRAARSLHSRSERHSPCLRVAQAQVRQRVFLFPSNISRCDFQFSVRVNSVGVVSNLFVDRRPVCMYLTLLL